MESPLGAPISANSTASGEPDALGKATESSAPVRQGLQTDLCPGRRDPLGLPIPRGQPVYQSGEKEGPNPQCERGDGGTDLVASPGPATPAGSRGDKRGRALHRALTRVRVQVEAGHVLSGRQRAGQA